MRYTGRAQWQRQGAGWFLRFDPPMYVPGGHRGAGTVPDYPEHDDPAVEQPWVPVTIAFEPIPVPALVQHCADCGVSETDASLAERPRHGFSVYLCASCDEDEARRVSAEDLGWEMDGEEP